MPRTKPAGSGVLWARYVFCGVALVSVCSPSENVAAESDFWEAVRHPGLRTYRAHLTGARTAIAAGRWEEVRSEATAALEIIDSRADAHVFIGRANGELSGGAEALVSFRTALALDPGSLDDPDEGGHAAIIASRAGDYPFAARVLRRVVGRMRPSAQRASAYALYGDVLLALGPDRLPEAVLALREAARGRGRGNVRVLLGLALALLRSGEPDEAFALAQRAGAHGPVDPVLSDLPLPESEREARRAVLLEAIGDDAGARTVWQRVEEGAVWSEFARLRAAESP